MNKIDWKQIWLNAWPHVVAIIAFVVISVVYFAPEFFDNKQLPQGDVQSGLGMGHDAKLYHEKTGEYADWSNAMFSGMPHNYAYSIEETEKFIREVVITGKDPKKEQREQFYKGYLFPKDGVMPSEKIFNMLKTAIGK